MLVPCRSFYAASVLFLCNFHCLFWLLRKLFVDMHAVFKMSLPCFSEAILSLKYCASEGNAIASFKERVKYEEKSVQRLARHIGAQTLLASRIHHSAWVFFLSDIAVRFASNIPAIITFWPSYVHSSELRFCQSVRTLLSNNVGQICLSFRRRIFIGQISRCLWQIRKHKHRLISPFLQRFQFCKWKFFVSHHHELR